MTRAEVLTLINNEIVTNGNNEITAAVLNPVLSAIVNQINDLVGSAVNLPIGETNVIDALNSITPQNIQIHTGTANPNATPPSSFNVGDFYSQTLSSVIIAFWQYNGIQWVEILSRAEQKLRNLKEVTGSYSLVLESDDTIVYNGSNISDVLTLSDDLLSANKIYVLVNVSVYDINISPSITDLEGEDKDTLFANSVLKIQNFGGKWYQINNNNDLSTGS